MKHIIFSIFIFVLVLLIGCQNGKESLIYPELIPLEADSIKTPPVLLSVTSLFTVGDDTLGIYQAKDDTLFSFWKLPECKFLFKAGIKGQGPDEFLALDHTFKGEKGGFKTFEIQTRKLKEVSITENQTFRIKAKDVGSNQNMNRFIFLEKDTYCFILMQGDSEFTLYNQEDGLRHVGKYPDLIEKKSGEVDMFVYNKLTVAHPEGDRFAVFYAYLKMCRIYGSDGTLQKEIYLDGPVEQENGQRKAYYSTQPYVTDKFIYVLANEPEGNVLEVWNWEAQIEKRFLLDKDFDKFIMYDGKLLGFSRELENFVYVYDLK